MQITACSCEGGSVDHNNRESQVYKRSQSPEGTGELDYSMCAQLLTTRSIFCDRVPWLSEHWRYEPVATRKTNISKGCSLARVVG